MNYHQKELSSEEEDRLVKRGTRIIIALLPLVACCLCGFFTSYTTDGRLIVSNFFLYSTYHGNIAMKGFSEIAQASCDLDQLNSRPGTYYADQNALETRYFNNLRIYRKYWNELKNNEGDSGSYPPPGHIPQTLNEAKVKYCNR
jgi:hypothetical protein